MTIIATSAIEVAVRAWLVTELAIEVIMARQATPRPASPYATILIPMPRTVGGYDDAGTLTDPGAPAWASRAMRGDRELTASIQFFGAGAFDLARQASNALNKAAIRGALEVAGIAPKDNGEATDLTELLETEFEERASLEVEFVFADEYTDTVPLIEHVTGTGTFDPGSKTDTFAADIV